MRHQKHQRRRAQTVSSQVVIKIQPGQKLLWQKNHHEYGFDLNLVDASTQENGPAYSGVRSKQKIGRAVRDQDFNRVNYHYSGPGAEVSQ